jgi:hypothetical protein
MLLCRSDSLRARRLHDADAQEGSTMDARAQPLSEHDLIDRLVHQSHYSVAELSHVTGIGRHTIQHAIITGELKAFVVDHHCLDILREDVVAWLRQHPQPVA